MKKFSAFNLKWAKQLFLRCFRFFSVLFSIRAIFSLYILKNQTEKFFAYVIKFKFSSSQDDSEVENQKISCFFFSFLSKKLLVGRKKGSKSDLHRCHKGKGNWKIFYLIFGDHKFKFWEFLRFFLFWKTIKSDFEKFFILGSLVQILRNFLISKITYWDFADIFWFWGS